MLTCSKNSAPSGAAYPKGRGRQRSAKKGPADEIFLDNADATLERKCMRSNNALKFENQTSPKSPVRSLTLSKHQAVAIKRTLVGKYCRGEISADAVARAFEVFPELKGA